MFKEYENVLKYMNMASNRFLEFAKQNSDENGNVDFELLESKGLLDSYKYYAKNATADRLRLKTFENFIKDRGQLEDEKSKDARGLELDDIIEKATKEGVNLADNAYPAKRDENGNFLPSVHTIEVNGREYEITGKSVAEQVQIYRQALEDELQKSVDPNMLSFEREVAIKKICAEVYADRDKILSKIVNAQTASKQS